MHAASSFEVFHGHGVDFEGRVRVACGQCSPALDDLTSTMVTVGRGTRGTNGSSQAVHVTKDVIDVARIEILVDTRTVTSTKITNHSSA